MSLRVLAFDTSGPWCSAALYEAGIIRVARHEEMAKGQAERLVGLLDDILAEADLTWANLNRIGVGVGPGNFTGIRIGVSTARGLAMGLGIPAIGVSRFDAIALEAKGIPAVAAPRGQVYLSPTGEAPRLASALEATDLMEDGVLATLEPDQLPGRIARIAADCPNAEDHPAPAPLYIKPADAAPPREAPPRILDDA